MNWHKIYALSLRHIYLIKGSFPRILDLIYWPTIQIFLWGFISKFFTLNSTYYENTVGIILSAAILYDFLFRSSISYNMMFLEEIWSRNFTNLFIAPIKISEIISALTFTAIFRTLIGLVPAAFLAIPLFGVSIFKIGLPLVFLLVSLVFLLGRSVFLCSRQDYSCDVETLITGCLDVHLVLILIENTSNEDILLGFCQIFYQMYL